MFQACNPHDEFSTVKFASFKGECKTMDYLLTIPKGNKFGSPENVETQSAAWHVFVGILLRRHLVRAVEPPESQVNIKATFSSFNEVS